METSNVSAHKIYEDRDTAHHEVAHLLMYMVCLSFEYDKSLFTLACQNRITRVYINDNIGDDGAAGAITTMKRFEREKPYVTMLCAGALSGWCFFLHAKEDAPVSRSLGHFDFAAKHYDVDGLTEIYKVCGGGSDAERIKSLCGEDTNLNRLTLDAISIFRHQLFIDMWSELASILYDRKKFDEYDILRIASEYKDKIYVLRDYIEQEKEKEKNVKKILKNIKKSWVDKVWHVFWFYFNGFDIPRKRRIYKLIKGKKI